MAGSNNQKVNYQITGENLLSKVLKQIDHDAENAEQSVNRISQTTTQSGGGLMGSIVGANLLTSAIQKTAGAFYNFGKESLDAYGKQENYEARLSTLLGNRAEAEMALGTIRKDAAKTPFDVESLVQANSLLIGAGANSKEARKYVMDLGNAIAATGGGSDELSRMAVNLGQIRSLGKATALDIKQFAFANIPIYELLSRSLKKPISEIKEMDISYKELTKALADARQEGGMFYKGLENASNTLQGLQSNLDDTIETLKSNIGETFADHVKESLRSLIPYLEQTNQLIGSVNKSSKSLERSGLGYQKYEGSQTRGEMAGFQQRIDEITYFAQGGKSESAQAKKSLQQYLKDISSEYSTAQAFANETGEEGPDAKRYLRQVALLHDAIKAVEQTNRINKDSQLGTGTGSRKDKDTLGTGTTIEAHAPKNQYITINGGLVNKMTIESMDGSLPAEKIKEVVGTSLIEFLNDASQAQR